MICFRKPLARTSFSLVFLQASLLSKKGSQYSEYGGPGPDRKRSKTLVFSDRDQLSQTIAQFHAERMLHKWTPIAGFESRHNERTVSEDKFLCFGGEIWRPKNASDLIGNDNSR